MKKIYYYKLKDKVLFSFNKYENIETLDEEKARNLSNDADLIYFLGQLGVSKARRSFCLSDPSLLFLESEGINLLQVDNSHNKGLLKVPKWIIDLINMKKIKYVNTNFPNWEKAIQYNKPKKWRINILGLGDVGTTLLTGLRLVGGENISQIGIYARSEDKVKRWEMELNQVLSPFNSSTFPEVVGVLKDKLFDCDMFVFCASNGVPPVGSKPGDVRMVQFKENAKIISQYAKQARENEFDGIFAVVSDPVDPLCKVALLESNKNSSDELDYKGLAPEQIRGYGLGVMNARACYYAKQNPKTSHYIHEGRAFGPHGEGLIIADSIKNYDENISAYLTEKARTANLEVRKIGYKPYIAPALSSGALSILGTINGNWHYSATYMGGVYMGANNRNTTAGIELERLDLPNTLVNKLKNTYERLGDII